MDRVKIGKLIQERREFLSLRQEDLAEMAGISSKTIYVLEQGKGNASLDTLEKILAVIGLELVVKIKSGIE